MQIELDPIKNLLDMDWNFSDAKTNHLTHSLHPYPAKFIPQIPNALIQELSIVGDTVCDIFCGSGTTLVEALSLKRNAVGIDANPLACLISQAKTHILETDALEELTHIDSKVFYLSKNTKEDFKSLHWRPDYPKLNFWFEPHVIEELAELLFYCLHISNRVAKNIALCTFSSIIVRVSNQDSDTRYVRRKKNILPGDVFKSFLKALDSAVKATRELSSHLEQHLSCEIITADLLAAPEFPSVDLVITSPPYPNAYSYHLYHMTRMLWLGMDQPLFKRSEIGSHRKYSNPSKNGANEDTFRDEFTAIMQWLSTKLKIGGYACFVVGNSTLKGKYVNNADIISEAGLCFGWLEVARIKRLLQSTKKSFNPSIGKIKTENLLILENRGHS